MDWGTVLLKEASHIKKAEGKKKGGDLALLEKMLSPDYFGSHRSPLGLEFIAV